MFKLTLWNLDKIKTMKHSGISGQKLAKNILSLFLIILPFWDLAGVSISSGNQQEQTTETVSPYVTDTAQPSETPLILDTKTATLIFESPTAASPPSTATVDTSIINQSLSDEFASSELLVRFRKRATKASIEQCIQSVTASITSDIEELNTFVLSVPAGRVAESIFNIESCPDLRYVEPNYLVHIADLIPSDPGWGNQYGLTNIRAPQGWEMDTGSSSVTIAILDTGIDLTHLDLAGKLVGGIDIINGDNNPQDDHGHGTHVAGIAAALSNNGTGVAGVSWGARLMPIKVLNAAGNGTYADVADGIIWAADHGAQIINLSLGGSNPSQLLQDAVDYAASRGVVVVAAAGNTGSNFVLYPARYPNVIAVAATDSSNAHAAISNYGPEVDLSAPGVSIYSTWLGGYDSRTGTSMAAPYVSGLAAILFGIPGNGSAAAVTQQMESTALDLGSSGWDDFYGHGLIQMDAALQLVFGNATPASPLPIPPVSLPGSSGGFVQLPTLTPSLTFTPLPTQTEILPASPASTSTDTPTLASINTPEVIALETEISNESNITDRFLPGCGISLIFLGILLFWMADRERRKNRKRFIRFR